MYPSFCSKERSILRELVPEQKYLEIKKFGPLAKKYNNRLDKADINQRRSGRQLRKELINMYGKKRIEWSAQLEENMLQGVSEGKNWKTMAKEEPFITYDINGTKIKQKFQSDMRLKFRIITRLFPFSMKVSQLNQTVGDQAFKFVLNQKVTRRIEKALKPEEIQILLKSRPFFLQSLFDEFEDKKKIRSPTVQKELLKVLQQCGVSVQKIAELLVRLSMALRHNISNVIFSVSPPTPATQSLPQPTPATLLLPPPTLSVSPPTLSLPPPPQLNPKKSMSHLSHFSKHLTASQNFLLLLSGSLELYKRDGKSSFTEVHGLKPYNGPMLNNKLKSFRSQLPEIFEGIDNDYIALQQSFWMSCMSNQLL